MLRSMILALLLQLAAAAVEEVADERTFKKILSDNPAVVVDFYSQTCGPCIMMAPKFKELAKEYEGRVKFVKVDVQRSYVGVQVRSMPTFHFYLNGKVDNQFSGADENGMRMYTQQLDRKAEAQTSRAPWARSRPSTRSTTPASWTPWTRSTKSTRPTSWCRSSRRSTARRPSTPRKTRAARRPRMRARAVAPPRRRWTSARWTSRTRRPRCTGGRWPRRRRRRSSSRRKTTGGARSWGAPAGMTAAIYSARAGLKPVVIAPAMGGQLMGKGVGVENYPGIMEANGGDIIKLMKSQAAKFQATFEHELVTSVDLSKRPFVIKTNVSALTAHALILSTGADSRWLGAPGEDTYRGGGVSSCATCDGFLWREKAVAVIGGGDTAMEDALVLARTSSHVTLIHRKDTFRASQILQQAVMSNPKITIAWNTTVKEFKGGDCSSEATCMLSHLVLQDVTDEANTTELPVDAAFVAIGHIPNTDLFKGQLDMSDSGYLLTREGNTHCSVDGVFAAGDVADWTYRQAVTSAGSGSQAALDAERWLSEQMVGASEEGEEEDEGEQCHPEDYEGWTMKKIRGELTAMGVDVSVGRAPLSATRCSTVPHRTARPHPRRAPHATHSPRCAARGRPAFHGRRRSRTSGDD